MKGTAPKACGVILEATHKLKGNQVPGYMKANFEKAWEKFDINQDGFIKAEETHTFMRSLMGKLNKFALAPGSLSDIEQPLMLIPNLRMLKSLQLRKLQPRKLQLKNQNQKQKRLLKKPPQQKKQPLKKHQKLLLMRLMLLQRKNEIKIWKWKRIISYLRNFSQLYE